MHRGRAVTSWRAPLATAVGVALANVGCAPPGPRAPAASVETLRATRAVRAPVDALISYVQAGKASGPRVILVHGTPGDATGWADFLVPPSDAWDVVALDRPGFGRSGPNGAMPSLAEQAAAVAALLPDDGRPVVLLGHSYGGPVVARVAADHPDRVAGLVLLAASMDPGQERIHPLQHVGAWAPVKRMLPRAIRNANHELMSLEPELRDLAQRLPHITAPVVIVHGTRDDLVPVANVEYMQARLTGSRCVKTVLLEGRNHFLPWNSVVDVRAAIGTAVAMAMAMAREPRC
jgi:pimeloyl-ACP methyl ester carboxylesterase